MPGGFYRFPEILTTTCISSLAYGFHICIAVSTLVVLAKQPGNQNPHRVPHGIFVVLLLVLGTINISIHLDSLVYRLKSVAQVDLYNLQTTMRSCFDPERGRHTSETPIECLGWSLLVDHMPYTQKTADSDLLDFERTRGQEIPALLISVLAQSYLLLRCYSLWGKRFVTVAMGTLVPAVIAVGVLNIYFLPADRGIVTPGYAYPFSLNGIPMDLLARVYWGLALGYNVSANALIVGRLLWLRARVTSAMGKDFGKIYTGIAAMLMESSTLYSVVLILGYTLLPGDGGSASVFSPLVAQTEAVAAELIILRLALGRALSRREVVTVTAAPHTSTKPDADDSNADGTASLVRQSRTSKAVGVRHTAHSTVSRFPSSVAAMLWSNQSDKVGS